MSKVKKKRRLTVLGRFVIVLFIGILFGASLGFYYRLTSDNVKKEEVKEQKILQQLFDVLDGRLPSMTKYERKDYNEFGEKLEKRYKYLKDTIDKKDYDNILNCVKDYMDMSNARNSFMDNLYFRDGLTTGITLMCEVFENNKNKED